MAWRYVLFGLLLILPASAQPQAPADDVRQSLAALRDDGGASRFYQLHGYGLAWSGTPAASADAQAARAALAHAGDEGLDPTRYVAARTGQPAADDVALTAALLIYMRDVAVGRPDLKKLDRDVSLPPRDFDAPALLDDALKHGGVAAMLAGLPPRHPQYQALRKALAQTTDPATRDTIAANMERWRWLPPALEPDRIVVNAAAQRLQLWLDDKPVLESRVIVGKPATPTPILRAEGAGVTVNPPWNIPHGIAVKELLPKLKKNPNYLANQNMELVNGPAGDPQGRSVDWNAIRAGTFPYRVRQKPGPHNSLGLVKLELPNSFDVYLHDTPARGLFAGDKRALSHGCVRVEQILPLASYALSADGSAMARIKAALGTGKTSYLPLKQRLPVYFLYWTAFSGDQGLEQARDIYGRDARLIAAMKKPLLRMASNDGGGCRKG